MKRSALQLWTLALWLVGLVLIEGLILTATLRYEVDTFVIKATDVTAFEAAFSPKDASVKAEATRRMRLLSAGKITQRTSATFKRYLKDGLPVEVEDGLLNWLVSNCAENRVSGLQMTFLQIYLPWLAVMIAGLLGHSSGGAKIPVTKARASIICSAALQVLFVLFLLNTLLVGDLGATRNVELLATLVTALVGTLVQFVFPASPEISKPVWADRDDAPAKGP